MSKEATEALGENAGGNEGDKTPTQQLSACLSISQSSVPDLQTNGSQLSLGAKAGDTAMVTVAQHLIDERHIWLSKCITQGFNILDQEFAMQVEKLMSQGTPLERVNRFLAPYGPRGLFVMLGALFPEEVRIVFDPSEVADWQVRKVCL